ncbi:ABC transporter substrate-binding protein [Rhizorhabdus dicambivorans]|uniref:ABC transporter substrate-binding protein n=1 Tax=Rhizorhabdus dicambivorans TaxID=1850238 RepID=A0A2A4FX90_9SPHN|nr:ABC transporter substrate-binding protein [Rhizorhabdus dicambivorans]ATE65357.1 ABC transporter substrate-binding protein [Rhizorhabdus dicambivorans]PCE42313.1 ABC transporter substrate-binding protein [Rhizorhabdus dicambivorans]
MLRRALPFFLAAIALGGPAQAAPKRIVSLSPCADQYLLELADPGQIVALNRFARDPRISWGWRKAMRYPGIRGSAEEMLTLKPDLVFSSGFGTPAALAVLKSRHVKLVQLPWDDSFESIERTARLVAAEIGHPERGEALVATMRARLKALGPPPGRGRVAAYYQRRGYLTGQGTLIDEMMRRAGLVNLATRLNRPMLSYLSVEQMAVARPDILFVENGRTVRDKGTEMLQHPLLRRVIPPARHIDIGEALTTCGGPSYPDAMAAMVRGIRQADGMAK